MNLAKQFEKSISKIKKANNKASFRALNKALAKTNTQFIRAVADKLKVPTKEIRNRFRTKKANATDPTGFLSYGIKYGLSYAALKPTVKLISQGRGKAKRKAVSVKLPEGRQTPSNAWLWNVGGKTLVLERKTNQRTPTATKRLDVTRYAPAIEPLNDFLRREYKAQFKDQLQYELKDL